jgi:hypothetical protein
MNKIDLKHLASYEEDFALWAAEQGALLRAGKLDRVDIENVAEEIESLGRSFEHEIDSRMNVLLAHLLKWEFQPGQRSNSWRATIFEQRTRIGRLLKESPSLRQYPATVIPDEYPLARLHASGETGLNESAFPSTCRYSIGQILDEKFFPGPAA